MVATVAGYSDFDRGLWNIQMRDLFNGVKRLEYMYLATSGFIIALLLRITLVG